MSSTARLGAFIVSALLILGVTIFMVGDKQFLFSRKYRLIAPFDNVAGLDEGAPVRAGGVRVGTVQRIILPGGPEDKIRVEMQLEDSSRNLIRKDSTASIETEGLLGKKYVAISFGSGGGEQLGDGDVIQGRPPFEYAGLARKTGELVDSAKDAVDSAKDAAGSAKGAFDSAKDAVESSRLGIGNINEASKNLKSITGKIDSGQGTVGALVSDPTAYRQLNAMLNQGKAGFTSLKEDMEALKHSPFVKDFFEKRGYFDSAELTRHAVQRLPVRAPLRKFTFDAKDLFEQPGTAKLRGRGPLDEVGAFLEGVPFGLVVVEAQTGPKGAKEDNLKLSQGRAIAVRQYLLQNFRVNDARIKTLGLGEDQRAAADSDGTVTIMVYPGMGSRRGVEVKNK